MPNQAPLVQVKNGAFTVKGRTVLRNISLDVNPGEIVTIIGPNGAGKSSLIRMILGLITPSAGTITQRNDISIGYMPQRFPIDGNLPISVQDFLKLTQANEEQITSALTQTGVLTIASTPLSDISGGELQRVLLARAILNKPNLLVLDEPTQGVDIGGQNQLYQLISNIRDQLNCGVLLVSHDLHLVMANSDLVVCLNQHICCHGHPETVSQHPEYQALFGDHSGNLAVYTHHHDHEHCLHGDVSEEGQCDHV